MAKQTKTIHIKRPYEPDCIHLVACRRYAKIIQSKIDKSIPRYCNATSCTAYQSYGVVNAENLQVALTQEFIDEFENKN